MSNFEEPAGFEAKGKALWPKRREGEPPLWLCIKYMHGCHGFPWRATRYTWLY